jgi:predicted neuraminidase
VKDFVTLLPHGGMVAFALAGVALAGASAALGEGPEAPFAAMSPEQVRRYEDEVREAYLAGDRSPETMRRVADLALIPPRLNTSPLPQYDYDRLDYGMTIGIERTPKGRLWAAWVAGEDGPQAFMVAATSDDDGETWSKPRLVIDGQSPNLPLPRSVLVGTLWTDPLGRLWFFFDQAMNMRDRRAGLWAAVCENPDAENPAWSNPRRIWHGRMLNKPTVLSTGEWLLPVYLLETPGLGPFAACAFPELDPYRGASVFVSTDAGATWQRRGTVPFPNPCWHEHMIVERKDGSLWMLARTRTGLMECCSDDRGKTWSTPAAPQGIDHPVARFHLRRTASGRILLVKHGETIDAHEGRSKLTAWLSEDEGATWKGGLMLDERKGISYPDGTQAPDGTLYLSYDRERSRLGEILMARITEDDILAGKLVSPNSRLKMLISRPWKNRNRVAP